LLLSRFLSSNWSGVVIAAATAVVAAFLLVFGVATEGWLGSTVLGLGAIVALLALALGAAAVRHLYLFAQWRKKFPPPGRLIGFGGYKLHYMVAGAGSPTVVWIPGSHSQGMAFNNLHERAAKFTRSIIFDRAGSGWSDTGPWPRTISLEAEELEAMLRLAGE